MSGVVRRASTESFERIAHLEGRIELLQADLLDQVSLQEAMRTSRPHEVYNLAAQSFVPTSWSQPVLTAEFTAVGRDADARGRPQRRPLDPLLPGVVVGDVRQGASRCRRPRRRRSIRAARMASRKCTGT